MTYIEKKRERRIRDRNRMKARAYRIGLMQRSMMFWDETKHCNAYRYYIQHNYVQRAEYMASCSCAMCGNPRRWFGRKTLQELRMLQD